MKAHEICQRLEKDEIEINENPRDRWHYMLEDLDTGCAIMCFEIVGDEDTPIEDLEFAFIGYL